MNRVISGRLKASLSYPFKGTVRPKLVLRGQDPTQVAGIRNYFQSRAGSIYMSLGYSCPDWRLFEELFYLLDMENKTGYKKLGMKQGSRNLTNAIVEELRRKQIHFVAIDCCHHLVKENLFYLLGLFYEGLGSTRFVCIFDAVYFHRWKVLNQSPQLDYFLNYFSPTLEFK